MWFLLIFYSNQGYSKDILVAASANIQYALEDIVVKFQEHSGIPVKTVYNSSGKLTAQILNGAPFNIFLSADLKYPETLDSAGFALNKPEIYAYGSLIIWTTKMLDLTMEIRSLLDGKVARIAIPNPATAPYGRAAVEAIKFYEVDKELHLKIVYGRNVTNVNQYVLSGAVDAGITSKSVVFSPKFSQVGSWIAIAPESYFPIAQAAVMLKSKDGQHSEETEKFYYFLFSDQAKKILENYGYRCE
jgi:molybdate transport system substrate-binding protein